MDVPPQVPPAGAQEGRGVRGSIRRSESLESRDPQRKDGGAQNAQFGKCATHLHEAQSMDALNQRAALKEL